MIEYSIFKMTFISINNSVGQLLLNKSAHTIITSLVMHDWSLVNFKNIHKTLKPILILTTQVMGILFLIIVKLRKIQKSSWHVIS